MWVGAIPLFLWARKSSPAGTSEQSGAESWLDQPSSNLPTKSDDRPRPSWDARRTLDRKWMLQNSRKSPRVNRSPSLPTGLSSLKPDEEIGMAATRVGIIGSGWIAGVHLRALSGFDDVKIVGIASRNPVSAGPLAESAGARVYLDYRSMLDGAELDAVFVCLAPYAHCEPALAVVERGIALFAEKPLGVDEEWPAEIAEAIHQKGVVSCVGYQWRYLEVVDRARELLESHPPQLVVGSWLGETPGAEWWIRQDRSGGQIVEQATHIFDLA